MLRIVAPAVIGAVAVFAGSAPGAAETIQFNAQLTNDITAPATAAARKGSANLSLDTASKVVTWNIEYSGLSGMPQGVGCGAPEAPGGPAVRPTGDLTSPIRGSKTLTDGEIAALRAGNWVCLIGTGDDEAEIGGVLQPTR